MLRLPNATEITPRRDSGVMDFGERSGGVDLEPVEVGYLLEDPKPVTDDGSTAYMQEGKLYAPRGYGLQHGDEIPLPEGAFKVVGGAQLDYVHPMNGHDYGYARYVIRLGG